MANKISSFSLVIESDEDGNISSDGHSARYKMKDENNPRMRASGKVELEPINVNDTVSQLWESAKQQILAKDAQDDTAFMERLNNGRGNN